MDAGTDDANERLNEAITKAAISTNFAERLRAEGRPAVTAADLAARTSTKEAPD